MDSPVSGYRSGYFLFSFSVIRHVKVAELMKLWPTK